MVKEETKGAGFVVGLYINLSIYLYILSLYLYWTKRKTSLFQLFELLSTLLVVVVNEEIILTTAIHTITSPWIQCCPL